MKRNISIFLMALIVAGSCRNKTVQIKGELENPVAGEYIFLHELKSNELLKIDSARITDKGSFSFKRDIEIPLFLILKLNDNNFLTMLAEPGERIEILAPHDSLSSPSSVTGSKGTIRMLDYNKTLKQTISKLMGLNAHYMKNVDNPSLPAIMDSLDNMAQTHIKEINSYTKSYINDNLTSLVSLIALYQQVAPNVYVLDPSADFSYFEKVDSSLYSLYPESEPVNALHNQVKELAASLKGENKSDAKAGPGDEAPEISLPTPEGKIINLHSTRGKIVLLDFWAAWCPPCRQESPNLVSAYDRFHKKGFDIYQVSLDRSKEDWVKGIETDKLGRWTHVSDIKYWSSVVVPLYGIESIPYNLLLDREGRIIAVNLRGGQLISKLEEVFK